jgi:hypothetical protein
VNLVGHVAVALHRGGPAPDTEFLVGCMLPDLSAIARVRLTTRPGGELGRGVAFHHDCDAAFHESAWFRAQNIQLRDALLAAAIAPGPARACAHAGVEMLLDGAFVADADVAGAVERTLAAVDRGAPRLAELAAPEQRVALRERLQAIGHSLDPARYANPCFGAERLHRMTAGRRRIELPRDQVGRVATALLAFQPIVVADAATVRATVATQAAGCA